MKKHVIIISISLFLSGCNIKDVSIFYISSSSDLDNSFYRDKNDNTFIPPKLKDIVIIPPVKEKENKDVAPLKKEEPKDSKILIQKNIKDIPPVKIEGIEESDILIKKATKDVPPILIPETLDVPPIKIDEVPEEKDSLIETNITIDIQ